MNEHDRPRQFLDRPDRELVKKGVKTWWSATKVMLLAVGGLFLFGGCFALCGFIYIAVGLAASQGGPPPPSFPRYMHPSQIGR